MINHLITKTTLLLIGIIIFSSCTLIQVENEKINETKSPNKETITEKVQLKKIPKDIVQEIMSNVLSKCNIEALLMSREIGLPPPIPLPKVKSN